jgi:Cu2+-exporting ATPase/Cu+-exporting ATPase
MEFFLEGVHCVACLWLIEKLPEFCEGVQRASLDLGRSVARITLDGAGSFSMVAATLNRIGYKPHPIRKDEEAEQLQKKENRTQLIRLGVAAACTGNIMLMAFSLYGGATGPIGNLFRWISLLLFLPVLCYSAVPFYQSALTALKTKSLSIDVPIVLAILVGFFASVFYLIRGGEPLYFDSLSALVFLLLASRFVLKRIQQGVLSSSHLLHFLAPSLALRIDPLTGEKREMRAESLKKGDWIEVSGGEVIPADGIVRKGASSVNSALLTGESLPQKVNAGDAVFSGTVNEDVVIQIEVSTSGADTRLGKILKEIEMGNQKKAPVATQADQLSRWFVAAVLFLGVGVFLAHLPHSANEGFTRALALIIVTCPCALALATPLAMSVSLHKAARRGLLIKGAETLERLSQVDTVILDKTGTLTEGRFEVLRWIELVHDSSRVKEAVLALESRSKHPLARALVRHLQRPSTRNSLEVKEFKENLGRGVSGSVDGHFYEIAALKEPCPGGENFRKRLETRVGVWRDGHLVAQGILGDRLRRDSKKALQKLKTLKLTPFLLSGDRETAVEKVGDLLQIPYDQAFGNACPEMKRDFIHRFPRALMVGDGANDAVALSSAFVGVAVHGSMEVSLRAADVYLSESGVMPVVELIEVARETMRVIRRNFTFSLFYNTAGCLAAILGWVNPLFAAVLMPASSLTVFGSSLLGTRKLRAFGRVNP